MLGSFYGIRWVLLVFGCFWILQGFTGFYKNLQGFTKFSWILHEFTWFYMGLHDLTKCHWVLLGYMFFSEFDGFL